MILVTGGAGFIGSNLVAGLEESGAGPLVVCDRNGVGDDGRTIAKRQLEACIEPEALFPFLDTHRAEMQAVFHLGAISSTMETDASLFARNNYRLSLDLWRWCADANVRFIYASSAATYGDGAMGFDDDGSKAALAALRPLNLYGRSKHLFDRRVAALIAKGAPQPPQWAGLKFFNVYGPNEYHKGNQKSVVATAYPVAAAGQPVRVANGGVDGQSSRGHIKAFELWFPNIPGLKPKIVLAYVGINDTAVTGSDASKFDDMRSPERGRRVRHYVMNHSVLYNQFRRVRGAFRARGAKLMHGGNSFKTGLWKPVNKFIGPEILRAKYSERLLGYTKRLVILAAAIQGYGAEPVFVTQPIGEFRSLGGSLEKLVQPEDLAENPEISDQALKTIGLFNGVTRAVCAAQKLRCIDLAALLQFKDGDFYDPLHTTPAGSQRIADFLFTALNRMRGR